MCSTIQPTHWQNVVGKLVFVNSRFEGIEFQQLGCSSTKHSVGIQHLGGTLLELGGQNPALVRTRGGAHALECVTHAAESANVVHWGIGLETM
jgi:hypothetical protein